MNPLDADTPSALFGDDALADRRSLKRAYARLVRLHPPELNPRVFAHIRRMYEAGEAHLRRATGRVSTPEPTVRADLGTWDAHTPWREHVERIERRALEGDLRHMLLGYGLLVAMAPGEAVPWLLKLSEVDSSASMIHRAVRATLQHLADRAADPALDMLFDALPVGVSNDLRAMRVERLLAYDPRLAADLWRRDQPSFRLEPSVALGVLRGCLARLRWFLSHEDLLAILQMINDVRLPLSDAEHVQIEVSVHAALAALQIKDTALEPIRELLSQQDLPGVASSALAMRDLRRVVHDPEALFMCLDEEHPGVASAVYQLIEEVSGADRYVAQWRSTGTAPTPVGRTTQGWIGDVREVEQRLLQRHWGVRRSTLRDRPAANADSFRYFIPGLTFAMFGVFVLKPEVGMALLVPYLVAMLMLFVRLVRHNSQSQEEAPQERWDPAEAPIWPVSAALVQRGADLGYWPHEVAGAVGLGRGSKRAEPLGVYIGSPARHLRLISDAHVRAAFASANPAMDPRLESPDVSE